MAQEIGLLAGLLDAVAMLLQGGARLAHLPRGLGDGLDLGGEAAEGVEDGPVRDGIDQGAVVVLAMDLDQGRADGLEHLDAHRLVVDEGAGAPVRHLDAAQDQVPVDVDIGLRRDPAGRMVEGTVEHGRDLALVLAMAHEAAVAAPAEGQGEGIEQDRLASARFTREDA